MDQALLSTPKNIATVQTLKQVVSKDENHT